jgi:copper(I)-binding protein
MRQFLAGSVLLVLAVATAYAHDYRAGEIHIDHPWARASIGAAKAGAAYMTLTNEGTEPDRLLAASVEVAEKAELHTTRMEDGVMRMRQVEAIELAPGESVAIEPGGLHIMMIGLKAPLAEGERFPMTLTFEKAGEVEVEVAVQAMGESTKGHGHDMPATE